ncbi:MAG: hypothetical protein IPM48_05085 [Saprospiraceae bacterium]|nr:hypothetical protein [Saprospiraceae bacterium]
MKTITTALFSLWASLLLFSQEIPYGKSRITLMSEGVEREFFVHVPLSYKSNIAVPLVFMLHGTGGDGEVFYNAHGWKELAEEENFIAVFPSALRYRITDNEGDKVTTKWNTPPDASFVFQSGQDPKDDILFLRKIIELIRQRANIDPQRIYLNGFSNGGNMAAKCSIEMGDVLAAVAQNASSFFIDTNYTPIRKLPVLYQLGDRDYGPGVDGEPAPLSLFSYLISTPGLPYKNGRLYQIAEAHKKYFELQDTFSLEGDTNRVMVATYLPKTNTAKKGYEFKYIFVRGLAHSYPNGDNHPFDSPRFHWEWMKQYTLEDHGAQDFELVVQDGYGDGFYQEAEVVHVWAAQKDGMVFTHWSGDVENLESPEEYHTVCTMPGKNISIRANYAVLEDDMRLTPTIIKAKENNKRIQIYLPSKDKLKGVVWFLHGTNGNATNMMYDIEVKQFVDRLMSKDYGVIGITSEESEFDIDFDNDGNFRWSYGLDTNLIDFANIRAVRDTLIARGRFDFQTDHFAFGYSAGGAFTEFLVNAMGWKAAINHNSSGSEILSQLAKIPYIVSISENDRNPGVGPVGNGQAKTNLKNYRDRGACAHLLEHKKSPLFPERFDRSSLISETLSKNIFQDLKNNDLLDENNFLKYFSDSLRIILLANPSAFPSIVTLNPAQLNDLENQIDVTNAEHNVKAEFHGFTMKFIEEFCNISSTNNTNKETAYFYPNPATDQIIFDKESGYQLFDCNGGLILRGKSIKVDLQHVQAGVYILDVENKKGKLIIVQR